jgi:hypothetical protein
LSSFEFELTNSEIKFELIPQIYISAPNEEKENWTIGGRKLKISSYNCSSSNKNNNNNNSKKRDK